MVHHKRTLSVSVPVLMMIVMASVEARNLLEATPADDLPDNEPDLSEPQQPVELPQFPSLPQPTFPSLPQPQLPSLPQPQLPSLPIPQLPSLPSLPIPQLPSLPSLPIPQLPSLPSIPQFLPSIPIFPNPSLAASKASQKP